MMMRNGKSKALGRILASLLSMTMVVSMLPLTKTAQAANGDLESKTAQAADGDLESKEAEDAGNALDGVTIEGRTLTYDGQPQELVAVAKLEGDEAAYYVEDGDVPVAEIPTAVDAGTYRVKVVVTRPGEGSRTETVTTTIEPKEIEGISIAGRELVYSEAEVAQELVILTGSFEEGDAVTWTVNDQNTTSREIPKAAAVGAYRIILTVDRGPNYKKLVTEAVTTNLIAGQLDLEGLTVKGLEGVYTVQNGQPVAQPAVTVENQGSYELWYQLDDGDQTVDESAWTDSIPTVTDAGAYIIWVKAVKDCYKDQYVDVEGAVSAVAPYNVFLAQAEQSFAFQKYTAGQTSSYELPGEVPYGREYDFSATDPETLAGGTIRYEVESTEEGIASIDANGLLKVDYPGTIKVIATLSGNKNYKECAIEHTLEVSGVAAFPGQYIRFEKRQTDYVLGTADILSDQAAVKKSNRIRGKISYRLDKAPGVDIDADTGVVTVTDYNQLAEAVRAASGSLELTVTATKAQTERYGADTASYVIRITFEAAPEAPYTLPSADGTNGWYVSDVEVTPGEGYTIAKNAADPFGDHITFSNEGTDTRYVYLRNTTTGGITDRIAVGLKIDTMAPDPDQMKIEIQDLTIIEKLGLRFGFYNPTVNIRFLVEDELANDESGLDHIIWYYTKDPNATSSILAEKTGILPVTKEEGRYGAVLSLTAAEAEQFRGHIGFKACDAAGNESNVVKENDVMIVVDTINPAVSAEFRAADPEGKYNPIDVDGARQHYYNGDVDFTFTIKEANFFSEDVAIQVTKDGAAHTVDTSWTTDGADDEIHYGKFTLRGDGDYVVTMSYKDQADNGMVDDTGTELCRYTSEVITIDTIKPVVKLDYIHDGDVQKTIFTVIEHNFRKDHVVIAGDSTMKDINGNDIAVTADQLTAILQTGSWTQKGDTYTTEYDQYLDGIYDLTMNYTDDSGWKADPFVAEKFIIDHSVPTEPEVEYVTKPWDTFLSAVTFGYYNPSVTVRFTAYDTVSGVESFTWGYTKEAGASTIRHPETLGDTTVPAVQDQTDKSRFTAEMTLTADEAAQYRGYLSVLADDAFQNRSVKKVDDGNIIVVDRIAPELSVEYTAAERVIGSDSYYNKDVEVKLTVTEANFYPEDIAVTVTKNGKPFRHGGITWGTRDGEDKTVGVFTLRAPEDHSGDGHYVIRVAYTDRSNNEMVTYVSDTHTIDTTRPVIHVDYQNRTVVNKLTDREGKEREYFADTQRAVITIHEHNFVSDEVEFAIIAKDVTGEELDAAALSSKTSWSVDATGDIHTIAITYPGDANYTFDMAYSDKAANAAEDYAADYFTVDKTEPENLRVAYSSSVLDTILESVTFGFYNAKMTVTLTAEDPTSEVDSFLYSYLKGDGVSSVNGELINEAIQAADIRYSQDRRSASASFDIPKNALGNDSQFNGTIEFTAADRAGNRTDSHREGKRIVVDSIAPTAQISYNEAVNTDGEAAYYNGSINATITINEANFYPEDVRVMVSKDGEAAVAVAPAWRDTNADIHVGTFTLTEDGDYLVTVNYTDKSANQMETYTSNLMTIDTEIEAPAFTINGEGKTEIGGAYKGEATVGFSFADQNFDTRTIKITRTRFDKVEDVTETFVKVSDNDKGGAGSFTIPSVVENDGIYLLTIGMTDKAKHTVESWMKFTINRFGSVYEYGDALSALIKDGGQYVTSVEDDLVIREYNADKLLDDSLKLLVTRDGENVEVDFTSNQERVNAQVGLEEEGWYQYVYRIKASNFEQDGVYKLSVISSYATSDSDKNDSTSIPENSTDGAGNQIVDTMSFTVDATPPEITNIIGLDKAIVNAADLTVTYTVVDVGGLKSVEIFADNKPLDTVTEFENLNSYTGAFTLNEKNNAQTVRIKVTDLAGNVTDTENIEEEEVPLGQFAFNNKVTVSTNFFARWYANAPLFWGSIGGIAALMAAAGVLIVWMRRKKGSN